MPACPTPRRLHLTAHEARNRASWDAYSDEYQAKHGAQLAASGGWPGERRRSPNRSCGSSATSPARTSWSSGCGAAQWSIALAQAGARPVGLDCSARQLEHARGLMAEAGVDFPLVHGSAEAVPLPDDSFDIVFCDHGAMTFADPYRTVPEAARLLRPGGLFAFSHHSPIETSLGRSATSRRRAARARLLRDAPLRRRGRLYFQLTYGEWIRLFRANGLVVEDLVEPRPPADATSTYRNADELAWARRWPSENIWRLRRE